jgi:hypothetical protein
LLARLPGLKGVLFDTPEVVSRAHAVLAGLDVSDRCEIVGGDFFDRVPAHADAYVLKRILYGWDDNEAGTLLRTVARAMRHESRLLIIEPVDEPGQTTDISSRYDLAMMVMKGCGARTREELEGLCRDAGLRITGITSTFMFPLIEARLAAE